MTYTNIESIDNELELIKKKIEYFFKENIPIHINLKAKSVTSRKFLNGYIKEIKKDMLILEDIIHLTKHFIFFVEIFEVFPYRQKEEI